MKLAHLLTILLELHCMAGYRDRDFSSVGRAPIRIEIVDKQDEDSNSGQCIVQGEWLEHGAKRSDLLLLTKEDFDRVAVGKKYAVVRSRSILHADPFALTLAKGRMD